MKTIECPQCGAYSYYTRTTCYKCGASLVDGTADKEPGSPARQLSPAREGAAILAAVLPCIGIWSFVILGLFTDWMATVAICMLPGLFLGAVAGDYLYRHRQDMRGLRAVNWAAAVTPPVAFLVGLLLAIGVTNGLEIFPLFLILLLPVAAVPGAVFAVLYVQQRRLAG